MKTLPWKTVFFDDRSGSWLEAYIPHLQWTYIVEQSQANLKKGYLCSVYLNNHAPEATPLHKTPVKSLRNAKEACLNHLLKTERGITKYLEEEKTPTTKRKYTIEKILLNRKLAA